jgi:hypothetical protein
MTDADTRADDTSVPDETDCMNGVALRPAANDNKPGPRPRGQWPREQRPRGQWPRGQSGNPRGKEKGTRHHATRLVELLLATEAQAITRTAITLALDGDVAALKLCLDRLAPPLKNRPVNLNLPPMHNAADLDHGQSALLDAMARGEIEPEQAIVVAQMFELKRRSIETHDIDARLARLEDRHMATDAQ